MRYRYRTDEEMKDSGVEWIGKIPKDWIINKVKHVTYCEDGKRIPLSSEQRGKREGTIPYWGANSIIDYIDDYLIDYEVVLLGEDGAPFFDKSKDVAFYSNEKIWPNNHVHILKPKKRINAKFLVNSLNIVDFKNYIKGSTRDKLTQSDMKEIFIQLPSNIREQEKIANFLDEKTSQFDLIISKKEKLIERLEEAKKSLISEVVTGKVKVVKTNNGYELVKRSSDEMKDSGVEWLGKIPNDWKASKIKYECSINARIGWKALKADEYVEDGYIFLATPNIKGKYIDFKNVNYITKERYDESPEIKLEVNDVLLTKDGSTLGTVNVVRNLAKEATVNSSIAVIRSNKILNGVFLNYFIKSSYMQSIISMFKDGMGVPHLFQSDIKVFNILLPPYEEQLLISECLDKKIDRIDNMLGKVTIQIEKLKEAKQSLISEAVTGKIEILD